MLELLRKNAQSWAIKVAFGIIIIVFIFYFGMGNFTDKKEPVVAYVDGQAISAREFQKAYEDTVTNMRRQNPGMSAEELNTPQLKQAILSQLVNTRLLLTAAGKMGVTVSPAELRSIISSIPAFQGQNGAFDPAAYKTALSQMHTSAQRFEDELKSNQVVQKLQAYTAISTMLTEPEAKAMFQWAREQVRLEYVTFSAKNFLDQVKPTDEQLAAHYETAKDRFKEPARIRLEYLPITVSELASAQKITDEDVKAYYDKRADEFVHPEQLHARHILIQAPQDAPKEVQDKAEAAIRSIAAEVRKGDFAAVAKKRSQDPGTAPSGGDLPWFSRGMMVKPFEDAVFALKPGQISEPVRTQYGWHIIKLEASRPAGKVPFEDVKAQIRRRMGEEKASEKVSEILDQSMDQIAAGVKLEKIAQGLGLSVKKSEMLDAAQIQAAFGLKKEAVDSLFGLADGASAKTPLAMENNKGYLLAEKLEGTPEATLPLDKVRDKVLAEYKAQEARKLAMNKAQDVLAKLRDAASRDQALAGLKGEVKTTQAMDRQAAVLEAGGNPQLLMAVFAAADKNWLAQPFETPSGVVLARLADRIPASEETWEKEKRFWTTQGAGTFRQDLFNALLQNLRASAKIEIVRQDLLN